MLFWTLAAECAANVYNMTVVPFKKSVTPYSARYPDRKLPKIPHFGSLCTYVPKAIEKNSSRSRQGIFLGYTRLPGGIVTDEYRVVPLSCFVQGLKQINIITTRDVRFPDDSPNFQIKTWNVLAQSRSYIEQFKPLKGEHYFQNIWNIDKNPDIVNSLSSAPQVFHDQNRAGSDQEGGGDEVDELVESDDDEDYNDVANDVDLVNAVSDILFDAVQSQSPRRAISAEQEIDLSSNLDEIVLEESVPVVPPVVEPVVETTAQWNRRYYIERDRIRSDKQAAKQLVNQKFYDDKHSNSYVPRSSTASSSSAPSVPVVVGTYHQPPGGSPGFDSRAASTGTVHANIQPSFAESSSSRIDLLEFACSSDSAIGRVSSELGINTVRLSLDIADLTTNKGLICC